MEATSTTSAIGTELFIRMVLSTWDSQLNRFNKLIDSLTDEELSAQVAPGRNTGLYLIGHMAAVHDGIIPLLGLGQRLHPELEEPFVKSADQPGNGAYTVAQLKQAWQEVSSYLTAKFAAMSAEDWFDRHTAVSAEDFAKEPHRNKLNLILNRTNHLSYHYGQLIFLKKK
jgi:uncharacterized damage-inducible protein DinB